ncbi:MAG TPA: S-layer homology domain-containing protein [Bacillota bacterium]
MLTRERFYIILLTTVFILLFSPSVQAMPTDIEGHWAENTIRSLVQLEIINGYPDGTFRPDQSITRAELAKILAVAYELTGSETNGFTDIEDHWAKEYITALAANKIISGYPDGTFQPERPVTRAEMVTMLTRLLKVGLEEEEYTQEFTPTFSDVPKDFWAFRQIELGARLGFLPGYYQSEFQPSRLASRADTAWMVSTMRNLKILRGEVLENSTESGLLTVLPEKGDVEIALLQPETIVLRNDITTSPEHIIKKDKVTIVFNQTEEPAIIKAYGDVNSNDLLSKISSMIKGRLTPDQVASILAGDWDSVKETLQGELYNEMIEAGLTTEEAESILVQDWQHLDTLGRDRLSEALSNYLGVTKDLCRAVLDRDIERIKEYAKIELTTIALSKLLEQGLTESLS